MFNNFKLEENKQSVDRLVNYRDILTENYSSNMDELKNAKLVLLESFNDGSQINNVDAIGQSIDEYMTSVSKIINNVEDMLSSVCGELDNINLSEKVNFISEHIEDIKDKNMKYKMYDYTVNTKPIKYIDINYFVNNFYKYMDRTIEQQDIDDLDSFREEFLQQVRKIASDSDNNGITKEEYRSFMTGLLRGGRSIDPDMADIPNISEPEETEYELNDDTVNFLLDTINGMPDFENYMTYEKDSFNSFASQIMSFGKSINGRELMNNNLNPNVSINQMNWKQSRRDNDAEHFGLIRDYIVKLFDLFIEVLDIYAITNIETFIAMRDEIEDAMNVLYESTNLVNNESYVSDSVIGESVNYYDAPCLIECVDYGVQFQENVNSCLYTLNECLIKISSYHPDDILNESSGVLLEAMNIKGQISSILQTIMQKISDLTNMFMSTVKGVTDKNKDWIEQMKDFNPKTIKDNVQFEVFPYWQGFNKLTGVRIPDYTDQDNELLLNDETQYKQKYFNQLIGKDGSFNNIKNILRGSDEKQILKGMQLLSMYSKMWNIINNFQSVAQNIKSQNQRIGSVLQRGINESKNTTMNESALMESTIYYEDIFYSILNEANGPATTDDLDNQNNNQQNNTNQNNNQQNNNGDNNNQQNQNNENTNTQDNSVAIRKYATICYSVNAIRMSILDEAYNAAVKFVYTVSRGSKINKKLGNTQEKEKEQKNDKKVNIKTEPKPTMKERVNNVKNNVKNNVNKQNIQEKANNAKTNIKEKANNAKTTINNKANQLKEKALNSKPAGVMNRLKNKFTK